MSDTNQPTRIALFGSRESDQLDALSKAVVSEGGEVVRCNIQLGGGGCASISVGGGEILWNGVDFSDIDACYIRGTALKTWPSVPPMMNEASYSELRSKFLREQESQAVVTSFFEQLQMAGKLVINTLTTAYMDHDTKPQLYEKLRSWGYGVPRTVTTSSSDVAASFIDVEGEAIVKPMVGIGSARLADQNSSQHMDEVAECPVMFQQRIVGDTVRVHIVGDKVVIALKILSDDTVDSRTNTRGFVLYEMPQQEQERIVSANRKLGLHFAAWDIMVDEAGACYYLDCNPGGYVMWIGKSYYQFLFTQLARYMLVWCQTRSIAAASQVVENYQEQ